MNDGTMQFHALTLDKFIEHAAKWHPDTEVVTARADGVSTRIGYAALKQRARRISGVLAGLGVRDGWRVATLAWNSQSHLEAWFAIMGMGATCHTLNPRLTAEQIGAMLRQSQAHILIVSADLLKLARAITAVAPLRHILVIDGDADEWSGEPAVQPLEELLAGAEPDFGWGGFDENVASGLCFTSGTTGEPRASPIRIVRPICTR